MFNLILYILTIKCISAVPLKFRDHQPDVVVAKDCSWLTIEYTTPEHIIQIPDECEGYDIDQDVQAKCDSQQFPMKCKFVLKQVQNSSAFLQNLLSVEGTARNPDIPRPNQQDEESMTKWVTVAMGKAMIFGQDGTICKPDSVFRGHRNVECDTCWASFIPYTCNCNCRGWDQYGVVCRQPCREHGDYTHDDGLLRCFKPCDRFGQMYARVGCGVGFDRVCVSGSWDCGWRWLERAFDAASVFANVVPGLGTAINKAAKAASLSLKGVSALKKLSKTAKIAGAIYQARKELRDVARSLKDKFKHVSEMNDAFSEMSWERKECIMEEGALRFLTANMPSVDGGIDYALDVAEVVDPTGVVSLTRGWIPSSDSCDSIAYCTVDHCPSLSTNTREPQGDPNHYQFVGNGWCLNSAGARAGSGNWKSTNVRDDGSAAHCEVQCDDNPNCMGYLTEDGSKCDLIWLDQDYAWGNGIHGIHSVDQETRVNCWKKKAYQYVGNGFCLNSNGDRMDMGEWETTDENCTGYMSEDGTKCEYVQDDGSAEHCEEKCNNDKNCAGYMSEDGIKCTILSKSNTCNSGTTMYADEETRNHCWKKTYTSYPDVRLTNYPRGRLQVRHGSNWNTVCGHWFWDNNNGAATACKNLGYPSGGIVHKIDGQTISGNNICIGLCGPGEQIGQCSSGCDSGDATRNAINSGPCDLGTDAVFEVECQGLRQG